MARRRPKRIAPSSLSDPLWTGFLADRSTNNRNALVEHYLPLVNHHARRLARITPDSVTEGDLAQDGVFGLVDAIEAFDPSRGIQFDSYANWRIRGAMLDGLRKCDWVPRLIRQRLQRIQQAIVRLEREGTQVTDQTLASHLGISRAVLADWTRNGCVPATVSMSEIHYETDSNKDVTTEHLLIDKHSISPDTRTLTLEWRERLLRGLSSTEKVILLLYHWRQWRMMDIGTHLGLSESRISQMHKAALIYLRNYRSREEFAEITSGGSFVPILPLLAFCHDERRRQQAKQAVYLAN